MWLKSQDKPRCVGKDTDFSTVFLCIWMFLAVLTNLPLWYPQLQVPHHQMTYLKEEEPFILGIFLVSVSMSIPMIIDLILDRELQKQEMYPRSMLILSLLFPNGLSLIAYRTTGPSDFYQMVTFCTSFMRWFLLIGSMMSYVFKYNYPMEFKRCAVYLSVGFAIDSLLHEYWVLNESRYLDILACTLNVVMYSLIVNFVSKAWNLLPDSSMNDAVSDDFRFGIYYATICTLTGILNLTMYLLFPQYAAICAATLDALVGTIGFIVAGQKARRAHFRVQSLLQSKEAFVRYIAHEIRTPLNVSVMGLELAKQQCDGWRNTRRSGDFTSHGDTLVDSLKSVEDAIDILSDLLLFDKSENGYLVLEREIVDLVPLVQNVFRIFVIQAQQKKLKYLFHVSPAAEGAMANLDTKKFGQVIRNFISNAMKFTPVGGEVIVSISLKSSFDSRSVDLSATGSVGSGFDTPVLRVEVTDSGVGIESENLKRLFKEVVQFNAAKLQNGGGSGLGLTIAKAIMDAHGGTVGALSSVGHGSTFFAEISTASDSAHSASGVRAINSTSGSTSKRPTPRMKPSTSIESNDESDVPFMIPKVLLVDDSDLSNKMLKKLMSPYVKELIVANSADNALNLFLESAPRGRRTKKFNIIFTDYHMPDMDGMELTLRLRKSGYDGFVILVSGDTSEVVRNKFLNYGGNEVIEKPVHEKQLQQVITRYNQLCCKVP